MTHKCDGCRYKGEHQEQGFVPIGVCLKETSLIKAEQNYKAECCPYIVDAYAEGTAEELQEVIEDLRGELQTEDFQQCEEVIQCEEAIQYVETIQGAVQKMVEVLTPLMIETWELIKNITYALSHYPNKKVLRLALYHPKERVRKKNMRRIMRWAEKLHRNKNF